MFELTIHGRGGQGAKTMALMLAEAAIEARSYAQAFPDFGPERTGAPIRSFLRVESEPILTHEPIEKPDAVAVLDETLLPTEDVLASLAGDPALIIDTSREKKAVQKQLEELLSAAGQGNFSGRIFPVHVADLLAGAKNKIHPTTPVIGKLIKVTEIVTLDNLKKTYERKFLEKIGEEALNETMQVLENAYSEL